MFSFPSSCSSAGLGGGIVRGRVMLVLEGICARKRDSKIPWWWFESGICGGGDAQVSSSVVTSCEGVLSSVRFGRGESEGGGPFFCWRSCPITP